MPLESWINAISEWYQTRKHDHDEILEGLIVTAPEEVWGPQVTTEQSKAIACWLDGCLRVYQGAKFSNPEKAYQFLQLAYTRLEQAIQNPLSAQELVDWGRARLQHITVLILEFCNQQDQSKWQTESHQVIESHVRLMATLDRKHDQGNHQFH